MSTPNPEGNLPEKNFIQDGQHKSPFSFLVWGCIFTVAICLIWGGWSWYFKKVNEEYAKNPFLQVTNRDFSIFLWQFPEYMRANVKNKSGYLPAFQSIGRLGMDPKLAEEYVVAPPELIFLYHTWDRLIHSEFTPRPIPSAEFNEFITYIDEWTPKNWPGAPQGYVQLIAKLPSIKDQDLAALPQTELPLIVRQAFEGWKNYMKEGDAINAMKPTYKETSAFLSGHPHYSRSYWRNIVMDTTPEYLIDFNKKSLDEKRIIPNEELAPFLRVALFNYIQAQKK